MTKLKECLFCGEKGSETVIKHGIEWDKCINCGCLESITEDSNSIIYNPCNNDVDGEIFSYRPDLSNVNATK